jgi:hypothetical protein
MRREIWLKCKIFFSKKIYSNCGLILLIKMSLT